MPTPKKVAPAGGTAPKRTQTRKPAEPKPAAPKSKAKPETAPQFNVEDLTAMFGVMIGAGLNELAGRIAGTREDPTDVPKMLADLAAPFDPAELDWRPQGKPITGRNGGADKALAVAYVKARAVQDRLDTVLPGRWRNEYRPGPNGGIMCGLSVRIVQPNGIAEWVTRWDGAENTHVEAVKGGFSDAEKRAAVQWGVFRYGYRLPVQFVPVDDRGRFTRRPELPPEFLPQTGKGLQRDDPERERIEQRFHAVGTEVAGSPKDWDLQRPFVIRAFSDHFGLDVSSFSTHALTTDQLQGLVRIIEAKKKRREPLITPARQLGEGRPPEPPPEADPEPDDDDDAPGYGLGDTLGEIDPEDDLPF